MAAEVMFPEHLVSFIQMKAWNQIANIFSIAFFFFFIFIYNKCNKTVKKKKVLKVLFYCKLYLTYAGSH